MNRIRIKDLVALIFHVQPVALLQVTLFELEGYLGPMSASGLLANKVTTPFRVAMQEVNLRKTFGVEQGAKGQIESLLTSKPINELGDDSVEHSTPPTSCA